MSIWKRASPYRPLRWKGHDICGMRVKNEMNVASRFSGCGPCRTAPCSTSTIGMGSTLSWTGTEPRSGARGLDTLTVEDASTYLLGPVLGLVLRLRGITCLHASAIDVGGHAIAVIGPPGSGKSTTAAIFATSGYRVLSDDVVALGDHGSAFLAQPSYPRLGLWSDSVATLFGSPDALPQQTPTWTKCYLDLTQNGYKFLPSPLPLRAVYVLSERDPHASAPLVRTLPVRQGLTQLIENTYLSYLLDRTMSVRDLDVLSRLAVSIPVRRLTPRADSAFLSGLRDVILDDFHALTSTT